MTKSTKASRVSVIVPNYNKAAYIRETLDSVLSQEGVVDVEVVVVDDASTDGSHEILAEYGDRIRLHRLPGNSGAAHARNTGAALSIGDYLMFLDADDVLAPGTLTAMVEALDGRADQFAACPWQRLRLEGDAWVVYSPERPLQPPGGDAIAAWLGRWYIPTCSILWPRELFEKSGGWDEDLTAADDEELMIRMLLRGTEIAHATAGEAYYRVFAAGGTLSTTGSQPLAASRLRGLHKIEREAVARGLLSRYRRPLGMAYYRLARSYLAPFPELSLASLRDADRLLKRAWVSGPLLHRVAALVLGLERKERITRWVARRGWVQRHRSITNIPA
ncbi:MAG: glycosyltransferase [Gemmatimonadetes bacterium]|nr:glycosyltransferase [Gemmatimonadota bacterium]